ncbi:MAG: hypothetical protein AAFR61_31280 [Bacteroidota bacterium]
MKRSTAIHILLGSLCALALLVTSLPAVAQGGVQLLETKKQGNAFLYKVKSQGKTFKVRLQPNNKVVAIAIRNMQNVLVGQATVNPFKAKPVDLTKVGPGTKFIWPFAVAQVGGANGKAKVYPPQSPYQKALSKCRQLCRQKYQSQTQTVQLAMLAPGGNDGGGDGDGSGNSGQGQTGPGSPDRGEIIIIMAKMETALNDYYNCVKACMQKAKEKYQEQKNNEKK